MIERLRVFGRRLCTRDNLIAAALLALAVALVWRAFYPGLGSFDSGQIIFEAQHGPVLDWWTPFGAAVLRVWLDLGGGLGAVWLAQVCLFVGGAFAVARMFVRAPWAAAATLVIVLWPPTLGQLATLSRDVFSMGLAMLSIAALGTALRADPLQRRWWTWVGVAFVLGLLAYLTRQNLIVILVCGAGAAAVTATAGHERFARTRMRIGAVVAAAVVTGLVAVAGGQIFNKATGVDAVHPERATWAYDLLAMSQRTGENLFPDELVRTYKVGRVTPRPNANTIGHFGWIDVTTAYTEKTPIGFWDASIAADEAPVLRKGWLDAIRSHPLDYAYVRARLAGAQAGLYSHRTDAYPGIQPTVAYPRIAHPRSFRRAESYLSAFVGGGAAVPLEFGWMYLLAATAFIVLLWRRKAPDRLLAVSIGAGIWLNLGILFFAAPAASYRYVDFIAPLSLLLGLWLLSTGPLKRAAQGRDAG